ncbi:MAG TPA: response regulator [Nocardioidaceae bacterium]
MVYLPLLLDLADPGEQGGETVLVVEDDPDTLSVVVDCLQEEGFTVTTATNGVEALERACHCVPDAIVLDLCLPVMSGPEFLQAWRRTAPTQPVPIIAMSGLNRDVSADELGVQAWLPKPFAVDALIHAVAAAVSRGGVHHAPLR